MSTLLYGAPTMTRTPNDGATVAVSWLPLYFCKSKSPPSVLCTSSYVCGTCQQPCSVVLPHVHQQPGVVMIGALGAMSRNLQ